MLLASSVLPVVVGDCHTATPPTPSQYQCCDQISSPSPMSLSAPPLNRRAKKCHAVSDVVTDTWCDTNCNRNPAYCPAQDCSCITTDSPTNQPTTAPTNAVLASCALHSVTTTECHELKVQDSAECLSEFWAAEALNYQEGWSQGACSEFEYDTSTSYNRTHFCGSLEYPAAGNLSTVTYRKLSCTDSADCHNRGNCTSQGKCSCEFPYTGAVCTQCVAGYFGEGCVPCLCNASHGGSCEDGLYGDGNSDTSRLHNMNYHNDIRVSIHNLGSNSNPDPQTDSTHRRMQPSLRLRFRMGWL